MSFIYERTIIISTTLRAGAATSSKAATIRRLRPRLRLWYDVGHDNVRRFGQHLCVADSVDESLHAVVAATVADASYASLDAVAVTFLRRPPAVLSQQHQRLVNDNLQ